MQGARGDRERFAEAQKKIAELNTRAMDKVTKSLTDDRKKAWKEMVGEKFDSKPDQPRHDS
jgi:hypothetical protein